MKRTWPWLVVAALLLAIGGSAAWLLRPQEPEEVVAGDTGMSEETTNQLLQEIGYLKGSAEGKSQ